MVWMSTERMPLFSVEQSEKFSGVYHIVEWQNGVFGAIGRQLNWSFYDKEDAVAALQCHYHDHFGELQEIE